MRILVADSDAVGAESVATELRRHGFGAEQCTTGAEVLARHADVDFILLDLALPDIDGLRLCEMLRTTTEVPIIAFSGPGTGLDRILCLQAGCDDCLAKPFGLRELLARIEAVLRRASALPRSEPIVRGGLRIDPDTREVRVDGRLVELTRIEYCLLHKLASHPRTVFTRADLMADVWGYPSDGRAALSPKASRTIDTHVGALRKKLGGVHWITTHRGVGFQLGT